MGTFSSIPRQNVAQISEGSTLSTHNGAVAVKDDINFPFNINLTELNPSGSQCKSFHSHFKPERTTILITIPFLPVVALFDHSYIRTLQPAPFLLGSTITEHQLASGFFTISASGNSGNGTSNNTLAYSDTAGNTFSRQVDAVDNVLVLDVQSGSLAPTPVPPTVGAGAGGTQGRGLPAPQVVRFPGKRFKSTPGGGGSG